MADKIKKAQEEIEAKEDNTQEGAIPDEEASVIAGGCIPEPATAPNARKGVHFSKSDRR